jgi:DNA repair photolyase
MTLTQGSAIPTPPPYKHAASVTGQVFFCAAPIRLDAYDGCQFGCVYCFSRRRSRVSAKAGVHAASPSAFAARLKRVQSGLHRSALDEFLSVRTPLQLGGLQDPFTPREGQHGITLALLGTLREHDYPTLISTKGSLVVDPNYLAILRDMNVVVRLSAAGVEESYRSAIDRRCGSFADTLGRIERMSRQGIATGLRIQPVIPGFEDDALKMTAMAAGAGVRQVSFEYLKVSTDSARSQARLLLDATGRDIFGIMRRQGVVKLGWDYALQPGAKRAFVHEARRLCRALGIRFGAGDTEFIPWSDGTGCCGSSDLLLRGAKQFTANLVGLVKTAVSDPLHKVLYSGLDRVWSPQRPISTYLNRESRTRQSGNGRSDWLSLVAHRWNGSAGPYSPDFFDGVEWTGEVGRDGKRIYDATRLAEVLAE